MTNQSTLTKIRNANTIAAMKTTNTTTILNTYTVGRATITWGILNDKRTPEQIAAHSARVDAELDRKHAEWRAGVVARGLIKP